MQQETIICASILQNAQDFRPNYIINFSTVHTTTQPFRRDSSISGDLVLYIDFVQYDS